MRSDASVSSVLLDEYAEHGRFQSRRHQGFTQRANVFLNLATLGAATAMQ
jgi:hypothetical protein